MDVDCEVVVGGGASHAIDDDDSSFDFRFVKRGPTFQAGDVLRFCTYYNLHILSQCKSLEDCVGESMKKVG